MDEIGPDSDQMRWRDLFGALQAYRGDRWSDDLILPWASRYFEVLEELRAIGQPEYHRARVAPGSGRGTALEGLYALSRVLDVLIALTQMMVEGELLQLERIGKIDISEADYMELVDRKTAGLFSACARLGALMAKTTEGPNEATETRDRKSVV